MKNNVSSAKPRISVIIPTIGRQSLIRAVESVLSQTVEVFEIIVVNDLSHRSHERITLDAKCVIVDSKKSGVAAARNAGLKKSSGDLIAFLDDDDFWIDTKLEQQLNFMLTMNLSINERWIITSRVSYVNNDQLYISPERVFSGARVIESLYTFGFGRAKTAFYTPTWIFPSRFCTTEFDENLTNREDIKFLLDLEAKSFKVYQMVEPLVTIEKSIERQISREKLGAIIEWIKYLYTLDRVASIKFALGLGSKIFVVRAFYMLTSLINTKSRNSKC